MDNYDLERRISGYNNEQTEKNYEYEPAAKNDIEFQKNHNKYYQTHSETIQPKHNFRTRSAFDSNKNIQANVYNKVINNIKKVYNMQKQVLYATELEKEKLVEDAKKKGKLMKDMLKGSLYELGSEQISKVIHREKRKLDVVRFKRLLKRRQDEKALELEDLKKQFKIANGIEESESKQESNQEDYFMTQVEQADEPEEDSQENVEQVSESEREVSHQVEEIEEPIRNNFFKAPYKTTGFAHGKPMYEYSKNSSTALQRNLLKNYPKTLLQIDHRWNAVPKYGEPINDKEHLKRVFTFDGALKGRRRQFVPTQKTKRHPQLEKIEAYFKDCNPDYIPRTPQMKIPTVFEIDKAPDNMQVNLDTLNLDTIQENTNFYTTKKHTQNKTVGPNPSFPVVQHNKFGSTTNKFPNLRGMASNSEQSDYYEN